MIKRAVRIFDIRPGDDKKDAAVKGVVAGLAVWGAVRIIMDYTIGTVKTIKAFKEE